MTGDIRHSAEKSRRQIVRKRVRAVLAGGLVLGVGAAVTLAAWNDSEFASATFGAGSFALEGSTTSASAGFSDQASAPGHTLVFTTAIDALSPDDVAYSPLWVRLAANTSSAADLSVASIESTDSTLANSEQLSYAVYALATDTASCDEAGIGGLTALASAGTLADDPAVVSDSTELASGSPATLPGGAVQLCIVVTASADLEQSGQTTATWQFTAASAS